MDKEIQQRLQWVKLYEQSGDAGLVCRRCGISRPTLRKWVLRYQANGIDGLRSLSRRPLSSPNAKVSDHHEHLILVLRSQRNLGARRIQSELLRQHDMSLGLLAEWQHYYNWSRPHSAHNGKSPMERYFELANETPYSDEVLKNYRRASERIQDANYKVDLELSKLKRSL
jgi:transposase-like protein